MGEPVSPPLVILLGFLAWGVVVGVAIGIGIGAWIW